MNKKKKADEEEIHGETKERKNQRIEKWKKKKMQPLMRDF